MTIFYKPQSEKQQEANLKAQETFKYFWREVYWEYRRIVPGLNFGMVKIPFVQIFEGESEPIVEHMWINNINFDGEVITGILVNDPNELTNVQKEDVVHKKVSEISDWMFAIEGKVYGGFTTQIMRAEMTEQERAEHDQMWQLDFGDPNYILVAYEQVENPDNLVEHPMSKNMKEQYQELLQKDKSHLTMVNDKGYSLLHHEAIAGNRTCVEVLLEFGIDKTLKTQTGKTALDFAKEMGWDHIVEILE